MSTFSPSNLHLLRHSLRTIKPEKSLRFYIEKLGMKLMQHGAIEPGGEQRFYLGFPLSDSMDTERIPPTLLELIFRPEDAPLQRGMGPGGKDGYWKIGLALPDVDLARESLLAAGVRVTEPGQFLDVGYLCHLKDPDGYSIELLQHRFAENHTACVPDPSLPLQNPATLGQITLRIKDPEASLDFYANKLGMKLLSRQHIEPYGFTLYFLACTDDEPPVSDLDAVENREWLWQRPYTQLELQHVWGTEKGAFSYPVGPETGFLGMTLSVSHSISKNEYLSSLKSFMPEPELEKERGPASSVQLFDPDGYAIRLLFT